MREHLAGRQVAHGSLASRGMDAACPTAYSDGNLPHRLPC
jgi:hypothetical protein